MKKVIRVVLEDGRIFQIDAHLVAQDKAKYYAERDKETTYQEEYDLALSDSEDLKDWLFSNMDWYDLNPVLFSSTYAKLSECPVRETLVVDADFPEYVWMLGDTNKVALKLIEEDINTFRYYRDAGCWGVSFEKNPDGDLFTKSLMDLLNNKKLIPCTRDEWKEDNKGYV